MYGDELQSESSHSSSDSGIDGTGISCVEACLCATNGINYSQARPV